MSKFLGTLVLSLTLFCSSAFAQQVTGPVAYPQDDVRTITFLLSGYHELAPRASFEAVPNGAAIVDALARRPHSFVSDRALIALGQYWPSADAYLLYAKVVASDATPVGTRHRAVLMFAQAFGDRAIPALRPLLASDDLQLQITTVQALGRIGTDESRDIVIALASTTTNPLLLEQIDRSSRVLR